MTQLDRRSFIKRLLTSSIATSSMTGLFTNFSIMQRVLAQTSNRFDDYKALVCVFLHGGNDSFNMLIPTNDIDYQSYQSVRQTLAYPQHELLAVTPKSEQPYALGMPNAMAALQPLFNQGKLAILANCGTLLQPISKAQALADQSKLPAQLFSHNDQQMLWQSGQIESSSASGWAGRMSDLLMDSQHRLSMNLSLAGNNLWQTGTNSRPYAIDAAGVETFAALDPEKPWNSSRVTTFAQLLNASQHKLALGYQQIVERAQTNIQLLSQVIESAPSTNITYPNSDLAQQLSMVAKLISQQQVLTQPRQIFFVSMGGFDTHDSQAVNHPLLLARLCSALAVFHSNLEQLGKSEQVTTFTMSDFGRTLTSNGDGTDHGWGGHQLILGGAVRGGDIYGQLPPSLQLNSNDDLADGRIIPTTSVDQYAATLAKWFGLSSSEINQVLPNLSRFAQPDLSFLN
jgi:uncharacterized protein (DUF1501 family)